MAAVLTVVGYSGSNAWAAEYQEYAGCCDASAAAAVNEALFAVASDEDNVLRLYRRDRGGPPVRTLNVSAFLGLAPGQEADLEGAARIGERIYWIGSHSRNKDGEFRPGRQVLFATRIVGEGESAELKPEGRPFRGLVVAFGNAPELAEWRLGRAAVRPGEDPGGLNIEGLAAGADGSLLIGFRNPVPHGLALWVPLLNPQGVIAGAAARLGPAQRLDLGGLGVRDMVWTGRRFLIVAGPAEGGGRHRLFAWSPGAGAPTEIDKAIPKKFQAESILVTGSDESQVELLSDDDGEKIGGTDCSKIRDSLSRRFRSLRVAL